jgi:hypothetical protein
MTRFSLTDIDSDRNGKHSDLPVKFLFEQYVSNKR